MNSKLSEYEKRIRELFRDIESEGTSVTLTSCCCKEAIQLTRPNEKTIDVDEVYDKDKEVWVWVIEK